MKKTVKALVDSHGDMPASVNRVSVAKKRKFGETEAADLNSDGLAAPENIFVYQDGVEGVTTCFKTNTAVMMSLFSVKTEDEFTSIPGRRPTSLRRRTGWVCSLPILALSVG